MTCHDVILSTNCRITVIIPIPVRHRRRSSRWSLDGFARSEISAGGEDVRYAATKKGVDDAARATNGPVECESGGHFWKSIPILYFLSIF